MVNIFADSNQCQVKRCERALPQDFILEFAGWNVQLGTGLIGVID